MAIFHCFLYVHQRVSLAAKLALRALGSEAGPAECFRRRQGGAAERSGGARSWNLTGTSQNNPIEIDDLPMKLADFPWLC